MGERPGLARLGGGDGQPGVLAVARTAGRGEEHPGPDAAGRLEHGQGAEDVDLGVEGGLGQGLAHVGLRGQVEDRLGPRRAHHGVEGVGLPDVDRWNSDSPGTWMARPPNRLSTTWTARPSASSASARLEPMKRRRP